MPGLFRPGYGILTLRFFILGIVLGALYDIFRIRRIASRKTADGVSHSPRLNGPPRLSLRPELWEALLTFLEDVVFWLITSVAMILMHYVFCRGMIRGYWVLCSIAGFSAYYFSIGRLTTRYAEAFVCVIRKAVSIFLAYTLRPIFRIFKRMVGLILKKIKKSREIAYSRKKAAEFLALADKAFLR